MIKDALVAGVITEGHVRPLISLGDPKLMLEVFKKILRENATVRQTEEIARKLKEKCNNKEPREAKNKLWIPEQDAMAKEIQEHFEFSKVKIEQSSKMARILIEVKGDVDMTSGKIKQIHDILTQSS